MAARNPTDFTRWFQTRQMIPGQKVLASPIDEVLDTMEYILDAGQLLISDRFVPISYTSTSFVTVATYRLYATDMCDVADVSSDEISATFYAHAGNDDGSSEGEVRLSSSKTSDSATLSVGTTEGIRWLSSSGSLNIKTNGLETDLDLEVRRTSGAGNILVAGLILVSDAR